MYGDNPVLGFYANKDIWFKGSHFWFLFDLIWFDYKWREQTNCKSSHFWHHVTHKNTGVHIVICRQDCKGRFPVFGASSETPMKLEFLYGFYLQTIQWNNLTITNTFDIKKSVHLVGPRTGLASEMYLSCI